MNKKYTIKENNPEIGYVFKDVSVQLFDGKLRTLIKSHQPLPAGAQTTVEMEVPENMENYAIKIYEGDSPDAELNCEILKSYINCSSFADTKKLFVKLDVAVSKRYWLTLSASIVNFGSIKDIPDRKIMKTVVSTARLLPPPLNIDGNLLNPINPKKSETLMDSQTNRPTENFVPQELRSLHQEYKILAFSEGKGLNSNDMLNTKLLDILENIDEMRSYLDDRLVKLKVKMQVLNDRLNKITVY